MICKEIVNNSLFFSHKYGIGTIVKLNASRANSRLLFVLRSSICPVIDEEQSRGCRIPNNNSF